MGLTPSEVRARCLRRVVRASAGCMVAVTGFAGSVACSSEAQSVRFVLINGAELPIWFGGATTADGVPGWFELSDGDGPINTSRGCGTSCDGNDGMEDCAPVYPSGVGRIEPGEAHSDSWWGSRYEWNEEDRCSEAIDVEEGEQLTARFCWAASYVVEVEQEGVPGIATIVEPECAVQSFSVGSVDEVSHVATASWPEASVRFVIENGGAEDIVVQQRFDCLTDPGWVTVYDLESRLSIRESCWLCPCGNSGGCTETCPDSCAAPAVERLSPGSIVELTWDGRHYAAMERGPCEQLEPAPRAPLYAELCWGTVDQIVGTVSTGEQIFEPHCERHELDLRVGAEVRVVASP